MPDFARLNNYLTAHRDRFEEDLCELLRIPSISTDPSYAQEVRQAGAWMHDFFQKMGLNVQLVETAGNPLVVAESPPVPGKPVALVYGHYDVQPPDPLHEWTSPPFEPTRRDGNLYARGASDDKGQMLTHVQSVQAWLESEGELPIQIKFVIEGEEEIGSANLTQYLATQGRGLASDVVVISDCSQFAPGRPAITYGLKGIAYFELRLDGPKQDLHSGSFGGAVANPANVLCQMLAAMIDENGKIKIPGFYDQVVPLTDSERLEFASLPFDERAFVSQLGVSGLSGETGYSTLERRWARPTFDVSGLTSGYQGEGAKTVLPAWASAKFSFRLVPNQNPQDISRALEAMLKAMCPPGIRMSLNTLHGGEGFLVSCDNPYMTAAARAIEKGFRNPPVFIREGGSIPVVTAFHQQLGAVVLLLGWGLNDDNLHSPDEKFSLADFHRGIKASTYLWHELSRIDPMPPETLKSTI